MKRLTYEEVKANENTNNYKALRVSLGSSDIASLTVRFSMQASPLHFGGDASYTAYVITESQKVPAHYTKVLEDTYWCTIYDDEEGVLRLYANKIEIYRAGEMGCLIRLMK